MISIREIHRNVSGLGTAARRYWNSPPKALRRDIESWLAVLEKVPQEERHPRRHITSPNGATIEYGDVIDALCRGVVCNSAHGYDFSGYRPKIDELKSYRIENQ